MVEQPRPARLREGRRGHPRAHRRRRRLPGQPLPAADLRPPDGARPALPRRVDRPPPPPPGGALPRGSPAPDAATGDLPEAGLRVASASPELFLARDGATVTS